MKYHFIYPDVGTYYYPSVHHGLAHLFSVLEYGGHQVSLHHIKKEPKAKEILTIVGREKPDFVGFTVMSNQIEYVKKWSKWIKEEYDIPIICGGVHATLNPEELLNTDFIDKVCVGEGEQAFIYNSFWIKRNGYIERGKPHRLIENLDELPFPDYDLFDCSQMLKARNGNFAVIVSRGCPFDCSYCSNHALRERQKGLGKYFRYRSVDNVMRQLEMLIDKYPIRSFSFADDIFGINKEWVLEFCDKYPQEIGLPFECNLRAETATKELLQILKGANCVKVEMGIESGCSWMRREILNRKMSNNQIIKAFGNARKLGIKTRAYNMIGLPYETPEMVRETINLNKEANPDQVAVFYFYPFKGTKLYDVCKKEGFIGDRQATSYVAESILDLPTITRKELGELYNEFYWYMISLEIQSYQFVIRNLFKVVGIVVMYLTGKNGIRIIRYLYIRLFGVFQLLKGVGR